MAVRPRPSLALGGGAPFTRPGGPGAASEEEAGDKESEATLATSGPGARQPHHRGFPQPHQGNDTRGRELLPLPSEDTYGRALNSHVVF